MVEDVGSQKEIAAEEVGDGLLCCVGDEDIRWGAAPADSIGRQHRQNQAATPGCQRVLCPG